MKKHLIYKQDESHKFWEIDASGTSHTVRYGRVGTAGRTTKTKFPNSAEALKDARRLIDSKLKKGYREQTPAGAASDSAETSGPGPLVVNATETSKFRKESLKAYVHPYVLDTGKYNVNGIDLPVDTMVFDPEDPGRVVYLKGILESYERLLLQTLDGQEFTRALDEFPEIAVNPLDMIQRKYYDKTDLRKTFLIKTGASPDTIKIKDVTKYMLHPSADAGKKNAVAVYDIIHPCLNLVAAKRAPEGRDGFGRSYQKAARTWLSYRYDFENGFVDSLNKDGIDFDTKAHAIIKSARKKINALFHEIQKQPHFGHELLADEDDLVECDGKEWRKATSIYDFPAQCKIYPKYIEMQLPPDAVYEGVWHMEGLPQEHVLMSLLYYEDVSSLETRINFKRLYNLPELQNIFWSSGQDMHANIMDKHVPGYVPLGRLNIAPRELYLIPNSCIHRVQPFENTGKQTATRRFWAFFIVDPRYADGIPDISTVSEKDIVSQGDSGYERELTANMKARQNFKSEQGQEQPYVHFCEH